jgi:ubiquinone/menaquinone biosynthesis C-methylase UbiE
MGRVLEPEVMDDECEVDAYLDGVATRHLERLDDTFVRAVTALRLPRRARVLDVGTGTGAIPVRLAQARPGLRITGVDLSAPMLSRARRRAREAGTPMVFRRANARRLPFGPRCFDLILSNSLLHHVPDPVPVLDEMARVLRSDGTLYVRDLRRPPARFITAHIRRHGRPYRGLMRTLFSNSVRAAFTLAEIRDAVAASRLRGARVRRLLDLYWVIEKPPRRPSRRRT